MSRFLTAFLFVLCFLSCTTNKTTWQSVSEINYPEREEDLYFDLTAVLENANLPEKISLKIQKNAAENPVFFRELHVILQGDPFLWILMDREHTLNDAYEPDDLVELEDGFYMVSRAGLLLRKCAVNSLEEMAAAAKSEGITLQASSAYRSYSYQIEVYERNTKRLGSLGAELTALPGHSQHQLGLVVDFGSINNKFAQTAEGHWLAANASRFGWSLSYPSGYENITGYREECWHYRYVGKELAKFIDSYFDGIQQYALKFIYERQKLK